MHSGCKARQHATPSGTHQPTMPEPSGCVCLLSPSLQASSCCRRCFDLRVRSCVKHLTHYITGSQAKETHTSKHACCFHGRPPTEHESTAHAHSLHIPSHTHSVHNFDKQQRTSSPHTPPQLRCCMVVLAHREHWPCTTFLQSHNSCLGARQASVKTASHNHRKQS